MVLTAFSVGALGFNNTTPVIYRRRYIEVDKNSINHVAEGVLVYV